MDASVVVAIVFGVVSIVGSVIGASFVIVQRITRIETRILTYDETVEKITARQQVLESHTGDITQRVTVLETKFEASGQCASRNEGKRSGW